MHAYRIGIASIMIHSVITHIYQPQSYVLLSTGEIRGDRMPGCRTYRLRCIGAEHMRSVDQGCNSLGKFND